MSTNMLGKLGFINFIWKLIKRKIFLVPSACPVGPEDRTGVSWWHKDLGNPVNPACPAKFFAENKRSEFIWGLLFFQ